MTDGDKTGAAAGEQTPGRHRRRRALLLAYACSPYRGSEPGAGWHRAVEIAKHCDTWVICKEQNYAEDIGRYLAERGEVPGLHFAFVPNSPLELLLKKVPGLWYLAYNLWHRRAYRRAVELHGEVRFDVAHQVTLAGFREPGYLWKLGIPFVWGPLGGTQNYPWRFLGRAGFAGALREGGRAVLNSLQFRYSLRVRRATRRAACILAGNSTAGWDFRWVYARPTVPMPCSGADLPAMQPAPRAARQGPLRILWCGVLGHHKALHLLLSALADVPEGVPYEVRILGAGPLERRWKALAKRSGVSPRCAWLGWVPHEEVGAHYEWADAFVFTSLRDTAPLVLLEALSHGVPLICLDHQGAADMVTAGCGVGIPVTTPAGTIAALREAIVSLAGDRSRLASLSEGAFKRAREFQWSRQGERIAEVYEQVLSDASGPAHRESLARRRRASGGRVLPLRAAARSFAGVVHVLGLNAARQAVSKRLHGPALTVLAYHRVNDQPSDDSPYTVSTAQFDEQLACIKRRWRVVGLADALAMKESSAAAEEAVVITLDDGYRDNFTNAAPILKKHGLTACFFLPSGLLAGAAGPEPADHTARMTTEEAKALHEMGFEIGSHTRSHPNLHEVSAEVAREEIGSSKRELEVLLGAPVPYFAYPGGKRGIHFDDTVKTIVGEQFRVCCTTNRGRNSIRTMDMLEVRRLCVQGWWSSFHFARELEGTFDFVSLLPGRL